jgi:HK97 family phage prohead protease
MKEKTFRGAMQIKAESEGQPGEFKAVFATFNVIDHDGDVTIPGAFEDGQKVRISYWGHRWQDLPVGRGEIHSDEKDAWVDGRFFLDTEAGKETYQTVKNLGELQEWSYGFDVLEHSFGKFDEQDVQFLRKMTVHEVSPVMLGAGIGTRTTGIKGSKRDGDGNPSDEGEGGDAKPSGEAGRLAVEIALDITEYCENEG